ncbi:MAG TPA: ABC transporter permease [Actinomycetota bacterium]
MSPRASVAIMRHEFRVLMTDPSTFVFLIVMPLVMAALTKQLFQGALAAEGFRGANGSEFAIPGMAVSFAAFGVGYAGFTFFRDHGWGTWDRLRATPASSLDLIAGKTVPVLLVTGLQLGLLFALGGPLLGLRVTGSGVALAVTIVALALALAAFGLAVTAVARTMQQLNAIGSVGGFAMAIIGGAFVPVSSMPDWAQAVAPVMPTYWAMKAFTSVILEGGGLGAVAVPAMMMLGFAVVFALLVAAKFRLEDTKAYYG